MNQPYSPAYLGTMVSMPQEGAIKTATEILIQYHNADIKDAQRIKIFSKVIGSIPDDILKGADLYFMRQSRAYASKQDVEEDELLYVASLRLFAEVMSKNVINSGNNIDGRIESALQTKEKLESGSHLHKM